MKIKKVSDRGTEEIIFDNVDGRILNITKAVMWPENFTKLSHIIVFIVQNDIYDYTRSAKLNPTEIYILDGTI